MRKQKWNDQWKFWEMQDSFALIWEVPGEAVEVTLPHDAMLAHRAYAESNNSGNTGFRDGGHFCYSKILEIQGKLLDKYVLQFDGAYENVAVYVNGQLAARHPYGYTQFYVDLTPFLESGKQNEIRVMTNNIAASSRWYTGGGIYRDVYLLTSDSPVYIIPDGVQIKTNKLDIKQNKSAEIEVTTYIKNESSDKKDVLLQTVIDETNQVNTEKITIEAKEERKIKQIIQLDGAQVWSENNPLLSLCESKLFAAGENEQRQCDTTATKFGVRIIKLDSLRGLTVNGESVKLRGACIHHDNGIIGAAAFKDAEYRKVKKLKQAGFNAIRMSHNPASIVLLEACDELGIYVMNESFDMWTRHKTDYDYANYFNDWWERDIEAMVQSSYNHPSVIMYCVGNEIPEIGTRHGVEICRKLTDKIKQMDDSRYTTVAINGVFSVGDIIPQVMQDVLGNGDDDKSDSVEGNVNEFLTLMDRNIDKLVVHDEISERIARASDTVDICGYNYMSARYEKDVKENPKRIIVGSETYPPEIGRNWDLVTKHAQIIGDFTWTGWDYIGEAGVGVPAYEFGEGGFGARFPSQLSYVGDIDITGFRRPASYYREIVYGLRDNPYITVQDPRHYDDMVIKTPWVLSEYTANWNYPEMVGRPIRVEIYSNGDEVELLLNKKSLGKKKIDGKNSYKVIYEMTYEEGVLEAISYKNGVKVGESGLCTPEDKPRLCASLEKNQMEELSYINIRWCDENNTVIQSSKQEISVVVEGALESWLGTGNPKPETNYTDLKTKLWNGRALLVVRKKDRKGEVKITIRNGEQSVEMAI